MTSEQIREAVEQVKVSCDLKMENYEMVSMRGALYELGYTEDDAQQVIEYVASRGFDYCLDPTIGSNSHFTNETKQLQYPTADVCYWGPDQLKSRLNCI
jgi:hypothetical protein